MAILILKRLDLDVSAVGTAVYVEGDIGVAIKLPSQSGCTCVGGNDHSTQRTNHASYTDFDLRSCLGERLCDNGS